MDDSMKYELRLGDRVLYEGRGAVVDSLTQTCAGLVMDDGTYVIARYEGIRGAES